MTRNTGRDADTADVHSEPREIDAQEGIMAYKSLESSHPVEIFNLPPLQIQTRDTTIKCGCPPSTARSPKDIVLTGIQNGNLTWMHWPCKPYLSSIPAKTQSKMNNHIQIAKDGMDTGIELEELLLGSLGPTATKADKRCIKHFTSKYRCDGPCRASPDTSDYICCKKCWAWQHKSCMLFGEEGDRGPPVCNHCYVNFLVHRDGFVTWQKKRLAQAALEASIFLRNPKTRHEVERRAWSRKLVAGFMFQNRSYFIKFVIARRRVEQLVRTARSARQNVQDAASRRQKASEPAPKSTGGKSAEVVEARPRKRAPRKAAKRKRVQEESDSDAENYDDTMDVDGWETMDATQPDIEEDGSDTIIVKPKNLSTKATASRTSNTAKKQKKDAATGSRPAEAVPSKGSGSKGKGKRASRKKSISSVSSEEPLELPPALKKTWKHSRTQKSHAARKSARDTVRRPAQESEAEAEDWEDDEAPEEPKKNPAPRRESGSRHRSALIDDSEEEPEKVLARRRRAKDRDWSALDNEVASRIKNAVAEDNREANPKKEGHRKSARPSQEADAEDGDGPQISCRCLNAKPTIDDCFQCGNCQMWQHLKCARRTASILPECNLCPSWARNSELRKSAEASSSSRPPKTKAKANTTAISSKAQSKQAPNSLQDPLLKLKAAEPRKPQSTSAPKTEPTPTPAASSKSAPPLIIRTPLGPEMKDEVHQLCSTVLWRTYCEIPTLGDSDADDVRSEDDATAMPPPPTPPADWLAETQERLTMMLEVFGPQQTQAFLSPVLSVFPRKKYNIIRTLRDMAIELLHRGAYKKAGKKALGVLGEVLALVDKGTYWKG